VKEEKQAVAEGKQETVANAAPDTMDVDMPGSDRDEHGCIPSAGYTWSEARQACVRIWEDGITLQAQGTTAAGEVAYLFMSDDQQKAEIFLPNNSTPVMLQRKGKEGAHYWEGGSYKLYPWKGYVLKENDKAVFAGG
jgi:hypothetical protein